MPTVEDPIDFIMDGDGKKPLKTVINNFCKLH